MRFWLKDSERRPDPAPARADARKAVLAGTGLWLIALVLCLVFLPQLDAAGFAWWLGCAGFGVALGVIGLVVVQQRRR
ncbi:MULTISPECIES: DUF2530 domain-containing protein [Microterricola]|uniref:DUF2530 domain-containing protein n=2 Tax=Microterricola TaxID=518733 RepID=A0A1H1YIL7_9MICO|nr:MULTISPECIES: DUF2530 domain-containing protein [Microterricola]PPL19727.1 DUF2530 domain-containing protein [Microterricola pindariensis]SDT21297.1 Protein of unknown function [Microterricola viridarii]